MSSSLAKFLQYAAPIGLAFIPGIGPVMAGMLSGGITGLATGSLQKGLMAGLMTGGLGAGLGSLSEAAGGAGAALGGTSAAGEMAGVDAAQEAAAEAAMQTPYENSLVGATQGASTATTTTPAVEGSRVEALKNAVSSGNGSALSDAFLSKNGFYAGLGAMGMASTDAQENAKNSQWQAYKEREARRMDFMNRPAPGPAPMPVFNYEDPYVSGQFGRKTPYLQGYRDGGTVNLWDFLRYGRPGLPFSGGHDLSTNPGAMVGPVERQRFLDVFRPGSEGGLQGHSFTPTRTFKKGGKVPQDDIGESEDEAITRGLQQQYKLREYEKDRYQSLDTDFTKDNAEGARGGSMRFYDREGKAITPRTRLPSDLEFSREVEAARSRIKMASGGYVPNTGTNEHSGLADQAFGGWSNDLLLNNNDITQQQYNWWDKWRDPLQLGERLSPASDSFIGRVLGMKFADGGLAALPGMERDIHRRRSGAAMLRRMYPDKKSALADMRTPDSPIAKMGITDAGDPLLSAAFPEDSGIGRLVTGPGDGKSDSIPAVIDGSQPAALSSGEFVIPAEAVSAMGRGSNEAGARKLQMMVNKVKPKRSYT